MRPYHLLVLGLGVAVPVSAQVDAVTVPIGTPVFLVTTVELSSKTNVKGDMVPLQVAEDVIVAGQVILSHGSEAMGQIADARAKGAMGMSGQLLVRPLYAKAGDRVIRLSGQTSDKASVTAGAVIGTIASGMPVFTGKSASIPAGARLSAMVERTVILPIKH